MYLAIFSALPAIWIGIGRRSLLWFYIVLSLVADLSDNLQPIQWASFRYKSNAWLLVDFFLVSTYLSHEVFKDKGRKVLWVVFALLGAWFAVRSIPIMRDKTNWEDAAVFTTVHILLCLAALYKVITNIEHLKIEQSPLFIFSASFLLYASVKLMLMLFADHFRHLDASIGQKVWMFHNVFSIVKNLAVARVLYLQKQSRTI